MGLHKNLNEKLFRAIRPINFLWDNEFNRPSPAAFKDKNGLSVEKAGQRTTNDVLESLSKKHNTETIVEISVKQCVQIDTYPINAPSHTNRYHVEIHNSPTEKLIEANKRRKMAEICTIYTIKN